MEKKTKLSEMTAKERIGYIWDYYKWYILLAIVGVIVVITIIRNLTSRKEDVLYVLMVNADTLINEEEPSDIFDEFLIGEGYDPAKEEILVNTSIRYLGGGAASDIYGMQAMTTILGSGTSDVCVMDEEVYTMEASEGAFLPVQFYLSEEELETLSDRILWVESDPDIQSIAEAGEDEGKGTLYARGIRLTGENDWESELYGDRIPVVGIAASSERPELSAKLVRYLLGLPEALPAESGV